MLFEHLVRGSLARPQLVLAGWLLVALGGLASFFRLPLDAFPDTTPHQVQVNTTAPALSPEEVEQQITWPLEQNLAALPGVTEFRSLSKFGLSQITLVFAEGTDRWLARQQVAERLQAVELPSAASAPRLGPVATGLGEVFHYLVRGEGRSLAELREAQDYLLRPRLLAVPGVAEVNTWGGDERRLEVLVEPKVLRTYDLSLTDLAQRLRENTGAVGGGNLDRAGESTLVQGDARVRTPEDLAGMLIRRHGGVPVRLGDLAQIQPGREIRRGAVTANGRGEVVLGLGFLLPGQNSAEVSRRLSQRLEEATSSLPPGLSAEVVYARTRLVDEVLATVRRNLFEGALLVLVILFAFLGSWRAGLVVAAVLPFSLLFASSLMVQAGIAGSLMSLGALDFGLLVDSAIVQVENASRRLRERAAEDLTQVVAEAALEVRRPTLYGELILAVVYLPVLALEGVEGKLFRPMAWTVLFALAGSTLASLTLVPVLTRAWVRPSPEPRPPWLVRAATAVYRPLLRRALDAPGTVLAVALLLVLNAGWLGSRLGSEFVPRLNEGSLVVNTVRLASVSLDESVRYGTQIERTLLEKFPAEVARVWTRTGSAEVATDPMGIELSDVFIDLHPRDRWQRAADQAELVAAMEEELASLPGMNFFFTQPIEMRVNEMVAGVRSDLGVKVFGDDLGLLREKARQIEALLLATPGAAEVSVEQVTGLPVVRVAADRGALARHGLPAQEVLATVEALAGVEVGEWFLGERRFPLVLRLQDEARADPDQLGELLVNAGGGQHLPLSALADLTTTEGPSTLQRENGRRRLVVQANVRGRDLGSFVEEVRRKIEAEVVLPAGWYVAYGGQFEHYQRARQRLGWVVPTALLLVVGLLYSTYRQIRDTLRVLTGIPLAWVGGLAALWLRGMPWSVSAVIGFVALSGVSVLADMVLVATIRHHLAAGLPVREAVERAALERLRPVLMTGLVAGLGFVPMALSAGLGAEVQRPLATVVVGGLFSSTLLTLVVLPVLFVAFRRSP